MTNLSARGPAATILAVLTGLLAGSGALADSARDWTVKARIIRLLKAWTATGMFVCVEGEDDQRKKRTFIEVGERANDN